MFSNRMASAFVFWMNILSFMGVSPLVLDPSNGKFTVSLRHRCKILWFWLWITTWGVLVLPGQIHELRQTENLVSLVFALTMWIACMGGIVGMFPMVFYSLDMCQTINSYWHLLERFEREYFYCFDISQDEVRNKLIEILFQLMIIAPTLVLFCAGLLSFLNPVGSAFPAFGVDPRLLHWSVALISCTWYTIFTTGFGLHIGIYAAWASSYFCYVLPIIKSELRCGLKTYKSCSALRTNPYRLALAWKSIYLTLKQFNVSFGFILVYIEAVIFCVVLMNFILLTFHTEEFSFFVQCTLVLIFMVAFGFWAVFLGMAGYHHSCTIRTKQSWEWTLFRRRWFGKKYTEKVLAACQPFGFGDGRQYCISRRRVLHFMMSVSSNTFCALLVYKDIYLGL